MVVTRLIIPLFIIKHVASTWLNNFLFLLTMKILESEFVKDSSLI